MSGEERILTERVLCYQRTGQGLKELLALLAGEIYGYPRCRGSRAEDDGGEFFLFFYPRLLRTLERFQDQGRPFEWYLHSVLRWHYLGYVRWKKRRERCWAAGALPALWEPQLVYGPADAKPIAEPQSEAFALPGWLGPEMADLLQLKNGTCLKKPVDRKRLLIWALKQVRSLREPDMEKLEAWTDTAEERLRALCSVLREGLERRERRLGLLVERRNRAFAALQLAQQALAGEAEPACRALLARRVDRARRCLRRSQERMARVPLQPSNRELAQALGLPKGTVDTSLYWLKRRLAENVRSAA